LRDETPRCSTGNRPGAFNAHSPGDGAAVQYDPFFAHRRASSLFEYLCEKNAVTHNPVKGVKRPRAESGEGKTPAIGDHQVRELLAAPGAETIKEKRDRAILSTLLYHALRREELCKLRVRDFRHARRGVPHLRVSGKGEKTRYLPLHPGTNELIHDYLEAAGHGADENNALFRPTRNNRTGRVDKALDPDMVYRLVRGYSAELGFEIGAHALRATSATNALDHQADIAKVQEWLGHANISTTRIYDHRPWRRGCAPGASRKSCLCLYASSLDGSGIARSCVPAGLYRTGQAYRRRAPSRAHRCGGGQARGVPRNRAAWDARAGGQPDALPVPYRVRGELIEVLRVLHGRQRWPDAP
jgi:site-specific recombinase XerD